MRKHCTVVYALPERQYLWHVELDEQDTVEQALVSARRQAEHSERGLSGSTGGQALLIPWGEAEVGIFGEIVSRDAVPGEGDRIEIYRPLLHDPKQARRARARLKRRTR